jgi:hypothetical protein
MPKTAIWCGRFLVLVGLIGYAFGIYVNAKSWTALIPAIVGIVLMALGYVARSNERLRMHLMHAAILVALIGLIAAASRLAMKASEFTVSAASLSQIAMGVICLVFIILSVRSFIAARQNL